MAIKRKMDLLTAVEQIVDKAKGTGLSSEFYRKADRYIKYLSERLELTKEQSVMMALFIDNSDDSSISISDFCKYLDCRTTKIIRYMAEIDVLEKRELVRCCRENKRIKYRVPIEVIDAQGRMIPVADNQLTFKVEGAGTFMAAGNADIKDEDPYFDSTHHAWKGRALCVIRSSQKAGNIRLSVSSPTLPTSVLKLSSR